MGRRSEKRIAMQEPILVRGKDSRGIPFVLTAQTADITASGASVTALIALGEPGAKVEIEYQGRRAWFRIQWVDKRGVSNRGRAGLKSLEPGNYIWGVQLDEWTPDPYQKLANVTKAESEAMAANAASPPPGSGRERRRFPRFSCRIETLVADEGGSIQLAAKVSDISLGGCYVEMLSPLPVEAPVELTLNPDTLTLNPDTLTLHVHGRVLTSQIGMGMGISFTAITPQDFERLREMVSPTPPEPGDPEVSAASQAIVSATLPANRASDRKRVSPAAPTTQETLEAVLRVLLRKGVVSEDELASEFEKLMAAKG